MKDMKQYCLPVLGRYNQILMSLSESQPWFLETGQYFPVTISDHHTVQCPVEWRPTAEQNPIQVCGMSKAAVR